MDNTFGTTLFAGRVPLRLRHIGFRVLLFIFVSLISAAVVKTWKQFSSDYIAHFDYVYPCVNGAIWHIRIYSFLNLITNHFNFSLGSILLKENNVINHLISSVLSYEFAIGSSVFQGAVCSHRKLSMNQMCFC